MIKHNTDRSASNIVTEIALMLINVDKIYPHPENPRKDLGDLSELVESIKKKGIMQNLTVIPGHWLTDGEYIEICTKYKENPSEELRKVMNRRWVPEGYTLIIGHRRCAAAKQAGLKELPCRIVDEMSQKEQVGTMLEENMQRNDLTIWEQANGFQMMLDLGDTETQIAEKTGFSKTTIRHRLNIAKLDQQELRKKEKDDTFQLSLMDLYALEKVEDISIRNKILKEAINSRELIWKSQNAADEAVRQKKIKEIEDMLKEAGVDKAPKKAETEQYSGKWEIVKEYPLDKNVPKRLGLPKKSSDKLYYLIPAYGRRICVIKKAAQKPESAEDKARKEKEKNKKQIKAMMKELNTRKRDFIGNILSGKIEPIKEVQKMQEEIWLSLVGMGAYLEYSAMRKFFTNKSDYDCTQKEKDEADSKINQLSVLFQMLTLLNYAMDNIGDIYDWQGQFVEGRAAKLNKAYAILVRYGWTFEENERQLLDGSHDLYEKRENQ